MPPRPATDSMRKSPKTSPGASGVTPFIVTGPISRSHSRPRASACGRAAPTLQGVSTQAAPAPLSYLGGRTFVDDQALLRGLLTAVLRAREGEPHRGPHESGG